MDKIEHMWAFIASDDGGEGIAAFKAPNDNMMMPMVCADDDRAESLKRMAQVIAIQSGKTVNLVKFSVREEIETFEPHFPGTPTP